MISIRSAHERGHAQHGWLDSHHTFSFADYHDPAHMGFRALRVINEDRVAAGQGFGKHPHRDMEILSYVIDGALQHADSTGTGSVIRPGDVQRMSAGSGVTHSEHNASRIDPVHFLQIWLVPSERGIAPGYEQRHFSDSDKQGKLRVVASRDGRDESVTIHADVTLYAGRFAANESAEHQLGEGRHAWLQVVRGKVSVNGQTLAAGDGAAMTNESAVRLAGVPASTEDAEVLLFDLA